MEGPWLDFQDVAVELMLHQVQAFGQVVLHARCQHDANAVRPTIPY